MDVISLNFYKLFFIKILFKENFLMNLLFLKKMKTRYNVKNIISIFEMCFETYPCQHNVKFYNKKGDVMILKMSMVDIYQLCIELDYPIPEHIKQEYSIWSNKK